MLCQNVLESNEAELDYRYQPPKDFHPDHLPFKKRKLYERIK